jgi:uncharacterized protein
VFKELEGKTLVTGFHGIGMVGFIAVNYMVKKLDTERIGWMHRDYMPSVVFSTREGLEMPVEFHRHGDIVFLKVGVLLDQEQSDRFMNDLFGELEKHPPREVIVLGGLGAEEEDVYGVANSKGGGVLKELGLRRFDKDITVFGPMASVILRGEEHGIPVVCVLPNASTKLPDPSAASRAITRLGGHFGFKVNVSDLKEEAKKIEERIKELGQKKGEVDMADRMFV